MNNRPPTDTRVPPLARQYPTLEGLKIPDALKTAIRRIYQLLYDLRDEMLQRLEGMQGDPGVSGLSTSVFHYRADTNSTSASDPGAGKIRWNNSTQASATFLYFDWLTDDKFDVTVLWQLMNAPDQFIIQDRDLAINHQIWQMTGPVVMMPDWFQIPVSFVSSSGAGAFSNNQQISVLIPATGGGGGGGGGGTVTHTGGALTADQPVFGAGSADIKVGTKTGNTNKLVSNTGTNVTGNTVKWDASGNLIDAGSAPGGGSGTVTSVALTVPAEFSVSGSPVTTSGTLAVSKATQTANLVYAGPTTGSAAAPTFRAVDPADLPLASSSAFGAVKVDGTTITAASGVISAVGGGGSGYWIPAITPITVANWTTLGSGGTRTNTTGPGGGGAIKITGTTGGVGNIYGASRTVAAGDFSYDFILWASIAPTNFSEIQLGFTDGTKTEGVLLISISGANGFGTGKCSALSSGTYADADGKVYLGLLFPPGGPLLVRLARVGTALKGSFSLDGGCTYTLMFNDTGPYLTASAIFFSCDPRSANTPAIATLISSTLV